MRFPIYLLISGFFLEKKTYISHNKCGYINTEQMQLAQIAVQNTLSPRCDLLANFIMQFIIVLTQAKIAPPNFAVLFRNLH